MKMSNYKQKQFEEKYRRRIKRFNKLNREQQEKSTKILLNKMQRKKEIKERIFEILKLEKNLAIADIQRKLGENRNTFNYWINIFEKEGWIKRKTIEGEGVEIRGQPKTLILNKKKIKEMEQLSSKRWKSFEEYNLKDILAEKILREIDEKQPSDKQHQRLIEMFKQFGKEGYGAKIIFLLYSDFIKIDYKLSLTDKGKKALEKIKKKKKSKKALGILA